MLCSIAHRAVVSLAFLVFGSTLLQAEAPDVAAISGNEALLLSGTRQITFEGRRAGEGYFSADGNRMVFQSERDPANPFYQIYVTDLETGDIEIVSPGFGKTTCAWIHPQGDRILFASTLDDPDAKTKQTDELELRATGKERRYSWDYDPAYELYAKDLASGMFTRLTDTKGYDAEASYSPSGKQIVFASNRCAYERELSDREKQLFEIDPASMIDLYIMDADGANVRRLTDVAGYDGGPFFSPDGQRICWRRFSEDGVTAEVYTMKTDGTDVKRLTEIGAMSWAPYFHPSGDYLIFTTNKHGFGNFELYLVRADGKGQPVRVTDTDGFDGLPVFLPDGDRLSWTSNRTKSKQSQIFLADWDDAKARQLLDLTDAESEDRTAALASAESSSPDFSPADVMRHVDYLTRPELGGRLTGTEGERRATAYVAAYLESLGLEPAGENGTFFQSFDFPAGSTLGKNNSMTTGDQTLVLNQDWVPLSFSADGEIGEAAIVFAGYGLQVPGGEGVDEYDSYVHLNVAGQWVLVFRDLPQEITPEQRQQMARYSSPRRKATVARDLGAKGIIFAAGPTSKVRNELIRFDADASQAGVSIGALSVTNEVAAKWLAETDQDLAKIQSELDDGSLAMGFPVEGAKANASVDIDRKRGTGRNVLARMNAGEQADASQPVVIVGAHVDHLGKGGSSNSLAKDDERDGIHVGADDNASGVAAMLEIAQYLAAEKKAGRLKAKRDLVIAGWSGEELGLFGSQAFVEAYGTLYPDAPKTVVDPDYAAAAAAHGMTTDAAPLTAAVAAYLNLDMVGRLREKLVIQGLGSSPGFDAEVQRRNVPVGLELTLDKTSTRLPTDASAFVARDVPILSAFTGAHEDYHTPRDTPDKLNYEGAAKISRLFALLARGFLTAAEPPKFELAEGEASEKDVPRANLTAYLGTIPDYVAGDVKGLKLSGVAGEGPAAKAGLKGGDVIIELSGRKIEDIYDYTYAIEALKIGEEVEIVVRRGQDDVKLMVTPTARD
ncbi:translocation protein TolB [Rubripirellula tenax]|uniref:Translocation protein TolB n=1 Tax=Rubripirellula tenax TaxID=2528015 RepID=A0A5C6EY82_9BACT|nr:M28 family peptidase [Rubripirellula tenax]TWU54593.1 translocation protein TolB [Rubripirellula tenax]